MHVFSWRSHSRMPYIQHVNYLFWGTGNLPTFHFVILCLGEWIAHKNPIQLWHQHNIRQAMPLTHYQSSLTWKPLPFPLLGVPLDIISYSRKHSSRVRNHMRNSLGQWFSNLDANIIITWGAFKNPVFQVTRQIITADSLLVRSRHQYFFLI